MMLHRHFDAKDPKVPEEMKEPKEDGKVAEGEDIVKTEPVQDKPKRGRKKAEN